MIVTVSKYLIDVTPRYVTGDVLTRVEANVLNEIWLPKLLTQLRRWLIKNPNANFAEIRAEFQRIQDTLVLDHDPGADLIETEAVAISKEKILARLAAEGLPPPNNLDLAAGELAQHSDIIALARQRVEARMRAGSELIAGS